MSTIPMRVRWLAAVLLLWTPHCQCQDLSQYVKNAMQSINHKMEQSASKLDYHELRAKKYWTDEMSILTALNNKTSDQGLLKNIISGLDERLSSLETILIKKEERESKTRKETNEALEGIMKSIQTLTSTVESLKIDKDLTEDYETKDKLERRLNLTDDKIDDVKIQIENFTKNFDEESLRSMCLTVIDLSPFAKHVADAEKLLNRYELKLDGYNIYTDNVSVVALTNEARNNHFIEEMKLQGENITKIQQLLSDTEGVWKELPKLSDFNNLQVGTNQTLDAVIRATEKINEISETSMRKLKTECHELSDQLLATNESIQQRIGEGTELANIVFGDISKGLGALRTQIESLITSNHVIRQTADDVKANKKGIERAANRILVQVGNLIGQLRTSVKATLNDKLEEMEILITGNQTDLNSKLETSVGDQMTKMWREIGIINVHLTASKTALDKLTEHTDKYVESNAKTLGEVKDDVGQISRRTLALSENLDNALGRLRHSTEEFNRMSGGLGDTMISLLNDVHAMQLKIDADSGLTKSSSTV